MGVCCLGDDCKHWKLLCSTCSRRQYYDKLLCPCSFHGLVVLSVNTEAGCYAWTLGVNTEAGCYAWTLGVNTEAGCYAWTLGVNTEAGATHGL
jgi:hypothetical protein